MNQLTALQLIEGGKDIRDKFVGNIDVLDKVKTVISLPNTEYSTIKMVAEYYMVDEGVIKMIIHRNKVELKLDGLKTIEGNELSNIKLLSGMKNRGRHLTLIPRKGILRIGMLLTDSKIAENVRTYLLAIEESSTLKQKQASLEIANLEWTPEQDKIIIDTILDYTKNNKGITNGIQKASELVNLPKSKVHTRWYYVLKRNLEKEKTVESSKGNTNPLNNNVDFVPLLDKLNLLQVSLEQSNDLKEKNLELSSKVFQLQSELYATKEILNERDKSITLLENTIKDRDDHIMRVIKERDSANTKIKRIQKKYKELETSVQTIFKATQESQDSLISQQPKMIHSEPSKPLLRFKQDRNGNLTEIK